MPQTLHGTSSLVRLPDRTLTRLENGVAQITRRYACRTSVAATFRSQFNVGATMPGEPGFIIKYGYVERKREDGFTEFEVVGVGPDPSVTDSGGLKAQDDRTVTTFPSGLVRIDRTYVCPTANEAAFRPILLKGNQPPQDDFSPAIDGLYIFPDPNEIRRDDGFTEFRVSSYGRVNTTGFFRQIGTVVDCGEYKQSTNYITIPVNVQQFVVPYAFDVNTVDFLGQYKAKEGTFYSSNVQRGNTKRKVKINGGIVTIPFGVTGTASGDSALAFSGGLIEDVPLSIGTGAPQIDVVNYGFWDEVTINYGY